MSETARTLLVSQEEGTVRITLNRPDKRNALNDMLISQLDRFFGDLPAGARAVVIDGKGEHFSSGLDLGEQVSRAPVDVMAHSQNWHRVMDRIQFCGVPVIAVLRGAVMGGGLEMASACHIRIAEKSAKFQMPEGLRGIFVGGGGSVRLSKLIGPDRLTEMMLTGRTYSGVEAAGIGLAHYLTDDDGGLEQALALATRVAANSYAINRMVIEAIARISNMSPEAGLYTESLAAALSHAGPDAEEGLRAFLEKRSPNFNPGA